MPDRRTRQALNRGAMLSSALALSTALATPALAQLVSYNANTPTVTSGQVQINSAGTTDTFTVQTPTAVLDFTPNGTPSGPENAILFQFAGTTANYRSAPGGTNFTVLNRIVPSNPSNPIQFNGTVRSQLESSTGVLSPGGSVWFYSPGGIILGNGALFDVGNLLLSTGDPTLGSGVIGSTTNLTISSAPNSGSRIHINQGAAITAGNAGSYIAMVAPEIFHEGQVNINGSAAYVTAEFATLSFAQGLFNISVSVGSSATATPLIHSGTTRFLDTGTPSRAYLVAVPKNDAVTLTIAGPQADIGFDIATKVGVENGIVVLTTSGVNDPGFPVYEGSGGPVDANISIAVTDGKFNAQVLGYANTKAEIVAAGTTVFGDDLNILAGKRATVSATGNGSTLSVAGDLDVVAVGPSVSTTAPVSGGVASISAESGTKIDVGGDLLLTANANRSVVVSGATGATTGGQASLNAIDGDISIGGTAEIQSFAVSRSLAIGGTSSVAVSGDGSLVVGNLLRLLASARGQEPSVVYGNTVGGSATGGNANLNVTGGSIIVGNQTVLDATAGGGDVLVGTSGGTGLGQGGNARIDVRGGGIIDLGDSIRVDTNAQGGNNQPTGGGANGLGGTSTVLVSENTTLNAGAITVTAIGTGGNGFDSGSALGGIAKLIIAATGGTINAAATNIDARATSGFTLSAPVGSGGSSGGTVGGSASLELQTTTGGAASTANLGTLNVQTTAFARDGQSSPTSSGGASVGGDATITVGAGVTLTAGDTDVSVSAFGGNTTGGGGGGSATDGEGAVIVLGTATLASLQVFAGATAGAGGASSGGAGTGGDSLVMADQGGQLTVTGALELYSFANGGAASAGNAGAAVGGPATISVKNGSRISAGSMFANAGGFGKSGFDGGDATGNTMTIEVQSGSTLAVAGNMSIEAKGIGGNSVAAASGHAGDGVAGEIELVVGSATLTVGGSAFLDASANGGAVQAGAVGAPGQGTGGDVSLRAEVGGTLAIGGGLDLNSTAFGGANQATGTGGSALGGHSELSVAAATLTVGAAITLRADARGGDGFDGGDAAGGLASLVTCDCGGSIDAPSAIFNVTGFGGNALSAAVGAGGSGGDGQGGTLLLQLDSTTGGATTTVDLGDIQLYANGHGGSGQSAAGSTGGSGTAGTNTVTVGTGTSLIGGPMQMDAFAPGGSSAGGGAAGAATGGSTALRVQGTVNLASLRVSSGAIAGSNTGSGNGGAASGGLLTLDVDAGGSLTVGGAIKLGTFGEGGSGGAAGGFGEGGASTLTLDGTLRGGSLQMGDGARGGQSTGAGIGGSGQGGDGLVAIGAGGDLGITGLADISATGEGGQAAGDGGDGLGGSISVGSLGLVSLGAFQATNIGSGGKSTGTGLSGDGIGGVNLLDVGGGTFAVGAGLTLNANGTGGLFTTAGDGEGGSAALSLDKGTITVGGLLIVQAEGAGGGNNDGGDGTGGTATVAVGSGGGSLTAGATLIFARGGGSPQTIAPLGSGGDGIGGTAALTLAATTGGAATTVTLGDLSILTNATGGNAGPSPTATGGDALGGTALLQVGTGASLTAGVTNLSGSAAGGNSAGGAAGNSVAGSATALVQGNATLGSLGLIGTAGIVSSNVFGGANTGAGNGGSAVAGDTSLTVEAGGNVTVTNALTLNSSGIGGAANTGLGGSGTGADALLIAQSGGRISGGSILLVGSAGGGVGGTGGDGAAGTSTVRAIGSGEIRVTTTSFAAVANAGGGNASNGGRGGDAVAGTVLVSGETGAGGTAQSGRLILGFSTLLTNAMAGAGGAGTAAGGRGGDAIAGRIDLVAEAGNGFVNTGITNIQAAAGGGAGGAASDGAGIGGRGGDATGGAINVGTIAGPASTANVGALNTGNLTASAPAVAGAGGNGGALGGQGGNALGGSSVLRATATPVTVGSVVLSGNAAGGNGGLNAAGARAAGGTAQGGDVALLVNPRANRTERGVLTAGAVTAAADTMGGLGAGNLAAPAFAGVAALVATGGNMNLASATLTATGNNAPIAPRRSNFTVSDGLIQVAGELKATVTGGFGIALVNNGDLQVDDFTLDVSGLIDFVDPPVGTPGGSLDIADAATFITGSDIAFEGDADLGSLTVTAGGAIALRNVKTRGGISLTGKGVTTLDLESTSGSVFVSSGVKVNAAGSSGGSIAVGNVRAGRDISLFAVNGITAGNLTAATMAGATSGEIAVGSLGGTISLGNLTGVDVAVAHDAQFAGPFGPTTIGNILAEAAFVLVEGDATIGNVTTAERVAGASADNALVAGLAARGNIKVGAVNAGAIAGITSYAGDVEVLSITTPASATVLAANSVRLGAVSTGTGATNSLFISNSSIILSGPLPAPFRDLTDANPATNGEGLAALAPIAIGGSITITGDVSTGNFLFANKGAFSAQAISATQGITLSGAVVAGNLASSGGDIVVSQAGPLVLGGIIGRNVRLTASRITAGAITATTAVELTAAGGTVTVNGAIAAPQITISSADLDIAPTGAIGGAGTQSLQLNALTGAAPLTLGGTGNGTGYTLDQAELGRLKAANITVTRQSTLLQGDYQAVLRDFTLNGAASGQQANLTSSTGSFTLNVPGSILVVGNVRLSNAEAGNSLVFNPSESFDLVTDAGSVGVFGAGGDLGGRLAINANDISVASSALFAAGTAIGFADLDPADLSSAEISEILAAINAPAAIAKPDGSLRANQIDLTARDFVVIQNSGTKDLAAGFSAGSGGLTVTNAAAGSAPLNLAINGQVRDSSGTAQTNGQTVSAVRFRTPASQASAVTAFANFSTVNGCTIRGTNCGNEEIATIAAEIADMVANSVKATASKVIEYRVTAVINAAPLEIVPIISVPVTGGGNPSLWEGGEDRDSDERERRK